MDKKKREKREEATVYKSGQSALNNLNYINQFIGSLSRAICTTRPAARKNLNVPQLWQYGSWSFQTGGTKLERFLPKNQHSQRKLLNFENWFNGEVSKSAKSPNLLTFKVNFLYQKLSESFSIFFSLKNINFKTLFF